MGKIQLKKLAVSELSTANVSDLYRRRKSNHDLVLVVKRKPNLQILAPEENYHVPSDLHLASNCTYFKVSENKVRVLYLDRKGTLFCKKYVVADVSAMKAIFALAIQEVLELVEA